MKCVEKEKEKKTYTHTYIYTHTHIYIYIYIYIYVHIKESIFFCSSQGCIPNIINQNGVIRSP